MTNEQIKTNAKATTKQVAQVVVSAVNENKKPIHKENVHQKIYIGPNLLGLPKYTVVASIDTPHIKGFIKDCSDIEKLFVPINKMAETEVRTKQKGTLEHRHYNKITEFIKNGKGEQ